MFKSLFKFYRGLHNYIHGNMSRDSMNDLSDDIINRYVEVNGSVSCFLFVCVMVQCLPIWIIIELIKTKLNKD